MKIKTLSLPIAVLFALLVVAGCSTKFNIGAPYKNITVVYGFLDMKDTAHYIRIQKAFLDQNKSALTMSQVPDSSFYANIDVKINRINNNTGTFHDSIHLNRVDLDLEGYPKQPGQFFNSPNYAYKFTNALDPLYTYQLVVTNLATGEVDSAQTLVIVDNNITVFKVDAVDDIGYNLSGLDFGSTGTNSNYDIDVIYTPGFGQVPSTQTTPVGIIQGIITFNWYDSNYITKTYTAHSYDYNLGYATLDGTGNYEYQVLDNNLYQGLLAGMGTAPANTVRLLDRSVISVYVSTNDFSLYEQTSATQGTGLTGTDIEPIYTNVKGANALGLFTARGVRSGKITITPATVDSLMASSYLAPAKIVGTIYH